MTCCVVDQRRDEKKSFPHELPLYASCTGINRCEYVCEDLLRSVHLLYRFKTPKYQDEQNKQNLYRTCRGQMNVQSRQRVLIPQFDHVVPTGGEHARFLMPVPLGIDADFVVRFDFLEHARCLPVPDDQMTIGVTTDHVGHVRREVHTACVTGHLEKHTRETCRDA